MSDFLGRLVQKSLPARERPSGQAELAARLPSLFEAPGGGVVAPEAAAEEHPPEVSFPVSDRKEDDRGPSPTVISPAHSSSQPAGTTGSPADVDLGLSSPEPQAAQQMRAEQGGRDEVPARPPIRAQIVRHEQTEIAGSPAAVSPSPSGPIRLTPPPAPPMPLTRQERRSENTATLTGQQGGTTIRISIGRIEVRAVHPPQSPATPRKTAAPTRLSLEEYVKQRSEAKR